MHRLHHTRTVGEVISGDGKVWSTFYSRLLCDYSSLYCLHTGLLEYLTYSKTNDFQPVQVKKTEDGLKAHLPGPVQNKRIFLYYGGAFKKCESGLTEYDNEFPNRYTYISSI